MLTAIFSCKKLGSGVGWPDTQLSIEQVQCTMCWPGPVSRPCSSSWTVLETARPRLSQATQATGRGGQCRCPARAVPHAHPRPTWLSISGDFPDEACVPLRAFAGPGGLHAVPTPSLLLTSVRALPALSTGRRGGIKGHKVQPLPGLERGQHSPGGSSVHAETRTSLVFRRPEESSSPCTAGLRQSRGGT